MNATLSGPPVTVSGGAGHLQHRRPHRVDRLGRGRGGIGLPAAQLQRYLNARICTSCTLELLANQTASAVCQELELKSIST
jgi:hypothetical protein